MTDSFVWLYLNILKFKCPFFITFALFWAQFFLMGLFDNDQLSILVWIEEFKKYFSWLLKLKSIFHISLLQELNTKNSVIYCISCVFLNFNHSILFFCFVNLKFLHQIQAVCTCVRCTTDRRRFLLIFKI